jgi:hypothetical protein
MAGVKFYVSPPDFSQVGASISKACRRLGASITLTPIDATHCVAFSDSGAMVAAKTAQKHGLPFADQAAYTTLSDRVALLELGVPSIKSVQATSDEAVLAAFDGPVFVKKHITFHKPADQWSYTSWSSAADLVANADAGFWSSGYIVQDYLGDSVEGFDITVAVNENSDMLLVLNMTFTGPRYWVWNSETSDRQPSQATMDALQSAIRRLNIQGGIYNIQIAEYQNRQMVMDWNIRPGGSHSYHGMDHGIFDRALAHIAGLPLPKERVFYTRNQHYANAKHIAGEAEKLGLSVRRDWDRRPDVVKSANSSDIVLFATGTDGDAIKQKFTIIGELLK